MARQITFRQLPGRMSQIGREFEAGASAVMRVAAEEGSRVVVTSTPVDTGEARSNWIGSLDAPAVGVRPPYAPYPKGRGPGLGEQANAQAAIAQNKAVFSLFDITRNKILYVANNVRHIARLNAGSSTQAPANFAARAAQAAATKVRGIRRVFIRRS